MKTQWKTMFVAGWLAVLVCPGWAAVAQGGGEDLERRVKTIDAETPPPQPPKEKEPHDTK